VESGHGRSRTHIMRFSLRGGVVTELEKVGGDSGQAERYILRCHARSLTPGKPINLGSVLDSTSWMGFRYQDNHWSFVKRTQPNQSELG